jgi:hypothetical protein
VRQWILTIAGERAPDECGGLLRISTLQMYDAKVMKRAGVPRGAASHLIQKALRSGDVSLLMLLHGEQECGFHGSLGVLVCLHS